MLKDAKNSAFLDQFILFFSNGEYLLNIDSTIQEH
jgi:hypothetical protein